MRILVISDIHANLTAFQAVLQAAGNVDATWCLGDVVGYGPDPNECASLLRSIPNMVCLMGNHDAAAIGQLDLNAFNNDARLSVQWTRDVLNFSAKEFLSALPDRYQASQILLVHGSPRNPIWEYLLDSCTIELNFNYFEDQLCFAGHTHIPMVYYNSHPDHPISWQRLHHGDTLQIKGRAILNPGSVGQPRDRDPRASYAIFETETQSWTSCRVSYDVDSVLERIRNAGLPQQHAKRLSGGW